VCVAINETIILKPVFGPEFGINIGVNALFKIVEGKKKREGIFLLLFFLKKS
jgi:hypothetical protein